MPFIRAQLSYSHGLHAAHRGWTSSLQGISVIELDKGLLCHCPLTSSLSTVVDLEVWQHLVSELEK